VSDEQEVLQVFLAEGRDHLERLELDLVALEAAPRDPGLLAGVYRAVHTIKGTCGFLGLEELQRLTHRAEDLLDALRAGEVSFDATVAQALLALVDDVRARLETIERTGGDPHSVDPGLLAALAAPMLASSDDPRPLGPFAPAHRGQGGAEPAVGPVAPGPVAHESSIRVDAALLDTLIDLAGELVLIRGRLAELAGEPSGGELVDTYRHLRRATDELLQSVRHARLQPIGTVTRKVPRIARDLAIMLDKRVGVTLAGEEVGVDRAINEVLGDALLHIVRNAVDHGLEPAAERVAAGKQPVGEIAVVASQEGGRVRVEVADDGRGIDGERLASRAIAAGLISREALAALAPDDRLQLIFLSGLSTRDRVSSVSGRGVGMDAVRARLARVGGTVEIGSAPGRGTTVSIDVPLTLAVVSCIAIRSAGQRYCIPQAGVREIVRLGDGDQVGIGGALLHRSRDGLIPLVDLAATFAGGRGGGAGAGRANGVADPGAGARAGDAAVIVTGQGRRFGLIVDAVGDPVEAVIKPLPVSVRSVPVFSGVTILSDGRPTLLLDLDALAAHIGLRTQPPALEPPAAGLEVLPSADRAELLLARGRSGRRLAVPIQAVSRLERAGRQRLRQASGREMLDCGETLLPLVRLDEATGERDLEVIVCAGAGGGVGLVVEAIEDVGVGEILLAAGEGHDGVARLDADHDVAELLDVDAYAAMVALRS
jgi:two-component system chemotaxis sensor kinase CheA